MHLHSCRRECTRNVFKARHMLQKPAPEISDAGINSMSDSGASFSCRCTTSNVIDCLWDPKAVNDVRRCISTKKMAAESGVKVMVPISGACRRGLILYCTVLFCSIVINIRVQIQVTNKRHIITHYLCWAQQHIAHPPYQSVTDHDLQPVTAVSFGNSYCNTVHIYISIRFRMNEQAPLSSASLHPCLLLRAAIANRL